MVSYPLLYTGNPCTWTSIYSGTVTIISQPKIVSLILSPIGLKQSAEIQSSYKKKCSISGQLLPIVTTPNGLWTRWRKDLLDLPVRSMMGLTARALQVPSSLPMKLKPRGILSNHTLRVSVKALKDLWEVWYTNPLQR